MTGVQRFFANNRNVLRQAILAASSVQPAAAVFRSAVTRSGNGTVQLTGSYSGAEDAAFEVEITSDTSATPRVSTPVFSGVGNGQLSGLAVDAGTAAEVFTVRLQDMGTDTTHAAAALEGVKLAAKVSGSSGNDIFITVDESALVFTDTSFTTLDEWSASQPFRLGDQWDFGGRALLVDGSLDAATPRLVFGDDPQVYRPYKKREGGQWRYYLTPELVRDIPAGTRVRAVTGSRSVTVDNGVTTQNHTGIVTVYDLLTSIRNTSTLLDVTGVIANDRQPGGMAVLDLPLRTRAYALPVSASGSKYATGLAGVAVKPGAPTESVLVTCENNDRVGAERWSVTGGVSGRLAEAVTGVAYESAILDFRVPRKEPETRPNAAVSMAVDYQNRAEGKVSPPVCFSNFTLGANATAKSITFTYKKRPSDECGCDQAAVSGRISATCLGLDEEAYMATLDPEYQTRLQDLYDWRSDFMQANTYIGNDRVNGNSLDRQLVESAVKVFADALALFYADATARAAWDSEFTKMKNELAEFTGLEKQWASGWTASTVYALAWVMPTAANDNGHVYLLVDGHGGASGTTEPVWPTDGSTVTDGDLTWRDAGLRRDSGLAEFSRGTLHQEWVVSVIVGFNTTRKPTVANDNGHYYLVIDVSGLTAAYIGPTGPTEPTWPTDGGTVVDGDVTWRDMGLRGQQYSVGDVVQPSKASANGHAYIALNSGRGGDIEPTWPTNGTTVTPTFSEVTWLDLGYWRQMGVTQEAVQDLLPAVTDIGEFITRYGARMDAIGIGMGIVPGKSEGSGAAGAACWSDPGDDYAWMAPGYLPAFTNRVWHSARMNLDGNVESTREFAFAIVCACPQHLREGDRVTISIGDITGGGKAYQVGDQFRVPVISAAALYLSGGVDGNDTHTWSVTGNVSGKLADYAVTHGAEAPYNSGGLHFTVYRGGIPFALGDQWQFAVEGGQYRWRKDGGTWSAASDIPAGSAALSDGLSALFNAGAAPSYVVGDSHAFLARQPYAPSHVQSPVDTVWQWSGSSATLTADLGGAQAIDAIVIARHTLPQGAIVTVEGGPDGVSWPESVILTWREGVMAELLATTWNVAWLRLTVTNATGGAIGWWWAGAALATQYSAGRVRLRRNYAVTRGGGLNPSGLYAGRGQGGEIAWSTFLGQADLDALLAMLDHVQANDEPIVFLPHIQHPAEAALVRIDVDGVDIDDDLQFQPDDQADRQISLTLPLAAVLS